MFLHFRDPKWREIVIAVADKNHVKSGIRVYSGVRVPGSDQYAERIAGTWERICHGILYLRHVWSAYSTHIRTRTYLSLMIDVWIVAAFLLEIFVDILPSAGIFYEASWISEAVKWVAAFYMLVNTFGETDCGIRENCSGGNRRFTPVPLQQIGSWPLYEPIIGGRFPETGGTVLAIAFACVLVERSFRSVQNPSLSTY